MIPKTVTGAVYCVGDVAGICVVVGVPSIESAYVEVKHVATDGVKIVEIGDGVSSPLKMGSVAGNVEDDVGFRIVRNNAT